MNRESPVRLGLYSAVGQHIGTLDEGQREHGQYSLPLDMRELASGYYNLRLTVDGRIYTLMILNSK